MLMQVPCKQKRKKPYRKNNKLHMENACFVLLTKINLWKTSFGWFSWLGNSFVPREVALEVHPVPHTISRCKKFNLCLKYSNSSRLKIACLPNFKLSYFTFHFFFFAWDTHKHINVLNYIKPSYRFLIFKICWCISKFGETVSGWVLIYYDEAWGIIFKN